MLPPARFAPVKNKESHVYVIEAPSVGVFKVGVSTNPRARLEGLRTSSPVPLHPVIQEPGTERDERMLHRLLHPWRSHGEWFFTEQGAVDALHSGLLKCRYRRVGYTGQLHHFTLGVYSPVVVFQVCIYCGNETYCVLGSERNNFKPRGNKPKITFHPAPHVSPTMDVLYGSFGKPSDSG